MTLRSLKFSGLVILAIATLLMVFHLREGAEPSEAALLKQHADVQEGKSKGTTEKTGKKVISPVLPENFFSHVRSSGDQKTKRSVLLKDVKYLLGFKDPQKGMYLSELGRNYAAEAIRDSRSPREALLDIDLFISVTQEAGDARELSNAAKAAVSAGAKLIDSLNESEREAYVREANDIKGNDIAGGVSKILGSLTGLQIVRDGAENISSISSLDDPISRSSAEATILNSSSSGNAELASTLARYYLSDSSVIIYDRDIEVKLFGPSFLEFSDNLSQVVLGAKPGPKRDRAMFQIAFELGRSDVESARAWLPLIDDPAVRAEASQMLAEAERKPKAGLPLGLPEGQDPFASH